MRTAWRTRVALGAALVAAAAMVTAGCGSGGSVDGGSVPTRPSTTTGATGTTEPGSTPDRVIVDVDVAEQETGDWNFGVGYSTVDGVVGACHVGVTAFDGGDWGLVPLALVAAPVKV